MDFTQYEAAIAICMKNPEQFVLDINYLDAKGNLTQRCVSPIGYLTPRLLSVYCLGRCEVRSLKLSRIMRMRFVVANEVLSPMAIKNLCVHCRERKRPDSHGNDSR